MNKVSNVVSKLLNLLEVPATKATIKETLNSHPHYPSLLSVRDTLLSLKVPNMSYSLEPQHLLELPTPCIVHLKEGYREEFTILKEINENQVVRLKDNQHWITEPIAEFEKRWSGVTMLVEPNESSGQHNFVQSRIKELINTIRNPLLLIFLTLAILGAFSNYLNSNQAWQSWLLLTFKTGGVLISLLLMTEFFDGTKYIKKVCNLNAQFNCSGVLKSKQAKLWGVISWSELVFTYFMGSFLWMTFNAQSTTVLGLLFYLNLFTLPFTVYSVYYQFFVQKKICLLCSIIVVLLWLEVYLMLPYYKNLNITGALAYGALISFLSPIAAWIFIKPLIEKQQAAQRQIAQAQKLKTDPKFFATILLTQEKMPLLGGVNPLVLGNLNALNTVTIVTNPLCGPCQQLHHDITELIEQTPDVKFELIFAVGDDPFKEKHQLAQYFLVDKQNEKQTIELMNSWYIQQPPSFEVWQESKNKISIPTETLDALHGHYKWCKMAEIKATPTTFINGYKTPIGYELNELKFVFSSLNINI